MWPKTPLITAALAVLSFVSDRLIDGWLQNAGIQVPWGALTVTLLAFLAGQLARDVQVPTSPLRLWIARRRELFDHVECWWMHQQVSPPSRSAYSRLVLRRTVRRGELRVWAWTWGAGRGKLIEKRTVSGPKGSDLRIVLATTQVFGDDHAVFGEAGGQHRLTTPEPNLVMIELVDGWRRQRVAVEVIYCPANGKAELLPVADEHSPFRWPEQSGFD